MPSLYGDKKQAFIRIPIYQPSTLECKVFFSHSSLVGFPVGSRARPPEKCPMTMYSLTVLLEELTLWAQLISRPYHHKSLLYLTVQNHKAHLFRCLLICDDDKSLCGTF